MRTIAYVDGYNFYHGRLKHSAYKWLDLRSFLAELIRIQNPASELVGVKFFTANIKARLAHRGAASVNAQDAYHRALIARGVEVILGPSVSSKKLHPVLSTVSQRTATTGFTSGRPKRSRPT